MTWEDNVVLGSPVSGGTYSGWFDKVYRWETGAGRYDYDQLFSGRVGHGTWDGSTTYTASTLSKTTAGAADPDWSADVFCDGQSNGLFRHEPWTEMYAAEALGWLHTDGTLYLDEWSMNQVGLGDDWDAWEAAGGGEAYERYYFADVVPPVSGESRFNCTSFSGDDSVFGTPTSPVVRKPTDGNTAYDAIFMSTVTSGVTGTAVNGTGAYTGSLPSVYNDSYWGALRPLALSVDGIPPGADSSTIGNAYGLYGTCNKPTFQLVLSVEALTQPIFPRRQNRRTDGLVGATRQGRAFAQTAMRQGPRRVL